MLVPLPHVACEPIKKVGIFSLLCEADHDAVYTFVAFSRAEEAFSSEDSSTGWFPYSTDTVEVSKVRDLQRVSNKRTITGAFSVVEEYALARDSVRAGRSLLSVDDAQ